MILEESATNVGDLFLDADNHFWYTASSGPYLTLCVCNMLIAVSQLQSITLGRDIESTLVVCHSADRTA